MSERLSRDRFLKLFLPGYGPIVDTLRHEPLSRETKLGFGLQLTTLSLLGGGYRLLAPEIKPSVADQIRSYEATTGERIPTFEEAKSYLSLVAALYAQSTGSSSSLENLLANTHLIRRDYQNIEEARELPKQGRNSPVIEALLRDYPSFDPSDALVDEIHSGVGRMGYAWTSQRYRKIFILLDRATGNYSPTGYYGQRQIPVPELQFRSINDVVPCEKRAPLVNLRSAYIHEASHQEGIMATKKAEGDLVVALKRAYTTAGIMPPSGPMSEYSVDGFEIAETILFSPDRKSLIQHPILKEFFADYVTASIAVANNLPFTVGYYPDHYPANLWRFRQVLTQAGISDEEVMAMHRNSSLREFLLKLAKGARNVTFDTDVSALAFGIQYFIPLREDTIPWKELKMYFPDLADEEYDYSSPSNVDPSPSHILGCAR